MRWKIRERIGRDRERGLSVLGKGERFQESVRSVMERAGSIGQWGMGIYRKGMEKLREW